MEFKNEIIALSEKIKGLLPKLETEEATKTSIILPFLKILGYDVHDPNYIVPEYTADVGLKKGEKVDYAILEDGEVAMLIECKHHDQSLSKHSSQLFRYFATKTKTRFAMLTNGKNFEFYSDIKDQNIMDDSPFFEFDITQISDSDLDILEWFHKTYFDINKVVLVAKELKYNKDLKKAIQSELSEPSLEFIKFWINKIYAGKLTERTLQEFTPMVEKAINEVKNSFK